jgi:uncharacterized protein YjbJ (UPF0337 family)
VYGVFKILNEPFTLKEDVMDQDFDEAKGRVKSAAGELTGDERLKTEGKMDKASGKIKKAVNRVTDKAKRATR